MKDKLLTAFNMDGYPFGITCMPKHVTKINISIDTKGLAVLRTESYLTKDDEKTITDHFARVQDSCTFIQTGELQKLRDDLERYKTKSASCI